MYQSTPRMPPVLIAISVDLLYCACVRMYMRVCVCVCVLHHFTTEVQTCTVVFLSLKGCSKQEKAQTSFNCSQF